MRDCFLSVNTLLIRGLDLDKGSDLKKFVRAGLGSEEEFQLRVDFVWGKGTKFSVFGVSAAPAVFTFVGLLL